jgi:hypothetical protein
MSGKFKYTATNSTVTQVARSRDAKSFCEGREAMIFGGINPHVEGSEVWQSWQEGYNTTSPQGLFDGCAYAIPIIMPDLIGLTIDAATLIVKNSGLTLGKVTGVTGVITAQYPPANLRVQPNFVVTLTSAVVAAQTVSITAPLNGNTVGGAVVTLTAITDNDVTAGVQFKINNVNLGTEITGFSPYTMTWDTTALADGSYTITAVSRAANSNLVTSSPVVVNVANI